VPDGTEAQVDRIALWLATAAVNAATLAAHPRAAKRWVTMRDEDVRDTHKPLDGVTRLSGEPFTVAGVEVQYPGQPVGPPSVWINCRCVLQPRRLEDAVADVLTAAAPVTEDAPQAVDEAVDELEGLDDDPGWDDDALPDEPTPWHGVLAPEGIASGDGRKFAADALTWRDLPLPLSWQKVNAAGHDGSVVVGQITDIQRDGDGLLRATGVFADTPEADEVIGLLAEGHLRGVSVDVDDAEMSVEEDGDEVGGEVTFSKGRICGATLCAIPAFPEAYVSLGVGDPVEEEPVDDTMTEPPFTDVALPFAEEFREYDAEARKRMAENGEALPDGSFPIADLEDLRNAIHAIGRAGDPEAAKAHIKKRARALGHEDLIPEGWAADLDSFKRGPGWVTEPVATKRIHDYWTVPGHKGYAKIRWGTPGDFRRLRRHLAKYVEPRFLNRTVAQWHHDALGYWPGELGKPGNPPNTPENRRRAARHASAAPAVVLASVTDMPVLPSKWFDNPGLDAPTALTIEDDGRVFGHLALWGTCHVGMGDVCVTPPRSAAGYAYFSTGAVLTDAGRVPVGQITMNTGHAGLSDDARAAAFHYDHTGSAVADVAVGEDEHGIWFAGAMRDVTPEQARGLSCAALSGDWRSIRGNLELVAALAVNVPGFPVPRRALAASGGVQTSLVAAGMVEEPVVDAVTAGADLVAAVADEIEARAAAKADRARRAEALAAEVRALRAERVASMGV
jgi:hypothetical protein